jgi:hypothetical protein
MKKQFQIFLILVSIVVNSVYGQTPKSWKYDFGTATGNLSPTSAAGVMSANDGISAHEHALLPAPADGQIARVWTGNSNVSGYTLVNSATIGSGSRLFFKAPASTSTSKFSILNIAGTSVISVGFRLKFQAGTTGDYRFAIGGDASTMDWSTAIPSSGATQFSNNINFNDASTSGLPAILLMHWNVASSNYKLSIREKRSTVSASLDGFKELDATLNPGVSFANGGEYYIQVYANNSATNATYTKINTTTHMGTTYTVAARSSHIWVNGIQLIYSTGNANFKDADNNLAADAALNAFVFLGYNATGNTAQAYLDDFTYANYMADLIALPIQLSAFNALPQNNSIKLNWTTETETNNSHFELLRSNNGISFSSIGTIKGNGTTSATQRYTYVDYKPLPGTSYYQLKQVDFDGNSSLSKMLAVKSLEDQTLFKVVAKPAQQAIELTFYADDHGVSSLRIIDVNGKKMLDKSIAVSKGHNRINVPANFQKGLYVANFKTANAISTVKFMY